MCFMLFAFLLYFMLILNILLFTISIYLKYFTIFKNVEFAQAAWTAIVWIYYIILYIILYYILYYNPKSEKVGTVWKTQIKKESSDF